MNNHYVITAAGGNPTAIEIVFEPKSREEYTKAGKKLMELYEKSYGVEQTGSLVILDGQAPHFEMSGGEFCGNAARAAALLISMQTGQNEFMFTMSGVTEAVSASVRNNHVTCAFKNLPKDQSLVDVGGVYATLVDLGGIVHVVIQENAFPTSTYENEHRAIVERLQLQEKPAVGVVWVEENETDIKIHPVVWVRDVDTFFYETSCGSGSIAAAAVSGAEKIAITQPSGEGIQVQFDRESTILSSSMEVVHERNYSHTD